MNQGETKTDEGNQQVTDNSEKKQDESVKEKYLTVKPYRLLQEKSKHTLKQALKLEIRSETVSPLDTQIAGHGSEDDGCSGMLMHKDGFVLKPVQLAPKGDREIGFYQAISGSELIETEFCKFTAKYFGTEKVKNSIGVPSSQDYLVLENLTQGFAKPCVMDIKIGAKTYGPDAPEDKKLKEDAKYIGTKFPLGFSVLGIIVHSAKSSTCVKRWTKTFGRTLTETNLDEVLTNYLNTAENDKEVVKSLAKCFLEQLEQILSLFMRQTKFHIYASSLLFVYDSSDLTAVKDHTSLRSAVRLKLIDFAHAFPGDGVLDYNYIFGLKNLTKLFSAFAEMD